MVTYAHDLAGATGSTFTMPIELGAVAQFVRAVSIAPTAHLTVAHGSSVPPTFLQTAMLWDSPGTNPFYDSDVEFGRLLHGAQRFDLVGPPPSVGDTLHVTRRIDSVYDKVGRQGGTMTFIIEITDFHDEDSGLVATTTNTRIITGHAPTGSGKGKTTSVSATPTPEGSVGDQAVDGTSRLTTEGPSPFTAPPLTIHDSVRYQAASGDLNPIHHDSAFAAAAGHPQPFAVGMRQVGLLVDMATSWLTREAVRSIDVRFRSPAWPGESLTYVCEMESLQEDGASSHAAVNLSCLKPDGAEHVSGSALFVLPTASPIIRQVSRV